MPMPTLDSLHTHIFLFHVYISVSLARMRRYTQLAYLFHQCATNLLSRNGRIADCTVRHPGVDRPFSSYCFKFYLIFYNSKFLKYLRFCFPCNFSVQIQVGQNCASIKIYDHFSFKIRQISILKSYEHDCNFFLGCVSLLHIFIRALLHFFISLQIHSYYFHLLIFFIMLFFRSQVYLVKSFN